MPVGELGETLVGCVAALEIHFEHPRHQRRQIFGAGRRKQLAADVAALAVAATHEDLVTLDDVVAEFDIGPQQADVANVMLGARVTAAGEVDVDRLVELEPLFDVVGDLERVALGVGGGVFAAGIAGAGDQSGPRTAGPPVETDRLDTRLGFCQPVVRNVGDQQVLPGS
jgi:hypothetical protein